jgi:hypothetical protein
MSVCTELCKMRVCIIQALIACTILSGGVRTAGIRLVNTFHPINFWPAQGLKFLTEQIRNVSSRNHNFLMNKFWTNSWTVAHGSLKHHHLRLVVPIRFNYFFMRYAHTSHTLQLDLQGCTPPPCKSIWSTPPSCAREIARVRKTMYTKGYTRQYHERVHRIVQNESLHYTGSDSLYNSFRGCANSRYQISEHFSSN